MANFLTTTGLSYHLEQLIKGAKERVWLISPYLKVNDRFRELLADANRLKLDIRILYGKNDLQPDESAWMKDLAYVHLSFVKNLHAKCYLNEEEALVTSMNLYEFSQVNNNEMGIYVTKTSDPELFKDIYAECQHLIRSADEVQISVEKVKKDAAPVGRSVPKEPPAHGKLAARATGHCIRCRSEIALNRKRPYCASDYEKWAQYGNEDYEDPYCHGCGAKTGATMKRPLCRDCFAKAS